MKKLILLLFIPFVSFSQTYKDVIMINSLDDFKRVMIENGYQFGSVSDDGTISYGFDLSNNRGRLKSKKWGNYFKSGNWNLFFYDIYKSEFDEIVLDIKDNCSFVNIENFNYKEHNYVTYKCDKSEFDGKIGFMTYNGGGYITYFPKE